MARLFIRAPFTKFLNRYPSEALDYFLERLRDNMVAPGRDPAALCKVPTPARALSLDPLTR